MHYETIEVERSGGVGLIALARPDVMNALNTRMRAEITRAVGDLGGAERVIVLTGRGRAFCSGQDLGDRSNAAEIDVERSLREEWTPMLRAIFDCPVPTIAAVQGPAAGAGANLALACDVVVAAESAYFVQAFTRIGLIPDAGGTYWLPRQMGAAKAMGAALFAERVSAREASDWGMIWEAVPDAGFEEHWRGRAAKLASGPTVAYRHLKRAIRGSWDNDLDGQLSLEAELQGACGRTRDFQEGVLAFLEKRPAAYEGR